MFLSFHYIYNFFFVFPSGQCDLYLCWASLCRHDVCWLGKLPPVAGGDSERWGDDGPAVPYVEQSGSSDHLWPPATRSHPVALPQRSPSQTADPQGWQDAAGPDCRLEPPWHTHSHSYTHCGDAVGLLKKPWRRKCYLKIPCHSHKWRMWSHSEHASQLRDA